MPFFAIEAEERLSVREAVIATGVRGLRTAEERLPRPPPIGFVQTTVPPSNLKIRPHLPITENDQGALRMDVVHVLDVEADDGQEILFVCPESGCRRRLVLKRSGEMVVIDRGDFFARHVGATGPISMNAGVSQ
jgi:hypothetical protein